MNEMRNQHRNVFQALSKCWKGDGKDVEAIIEIHSELLLGHQGGKVLIGRCHDADVDATSISTAQPFELLFLQNSQQLGLQLQRNVADFIQEQRAAVRRLEAAQLL